MNPQLKIGTPIALLLVLLLFAWDYLEKNPPQLPQPQQPDGVTGTDFFFCSWNVENLFDDRRDGRGNRADTEFDEWLADEPNVLKLKLRKLGDALLKMNGGKGPDLLALIEVESPRAAELLQHALNERLSNPALHYKHVAMVENHVGRNIAPALLSRLPFAGEPRALGSRGKRILEVQVVANGKPLTILASHWTSRLDGGGEQRNSYGDILYHRFQEYYQKSPQTDLLICGDFNDTPSDVSVTTHLRASGDMEQVRANREPLLFNLLANKDPAGAYGTYYYGGKWQTLDQIVVSPGLLDREGWSCDVQSVRAFKELTRDGDRLHRPWRFGSRTEKGERGYSDHFPITVQLNVH